MNKVAILLSVILFNACASAPLTDEAMRVRIVSTSPMNCEYLGRVYGSYRGKSVTGGIVGDVDEAGENDMLNNAGAMGADTVEVMRSSGGKYSAEAYRCGKKPIAP